MRAGNAYARDVAQYVYSKAGKAYSVIDRSANDARVQIEIPAKCKAIQGLLRPIITHHPTYYVPD